MSIRIASIFAALAMFAAPAVAQQKADFIDGTYVLNPEGCGMLKALADGATESIDTTPWTVTADGISFWEGGCGWSKVEKKGDSWALTADCEEEESYTENYLIRRAAPDTLTVTLTTPGAAEQDRQPHTYLKCDVK